MEIKNLLKSMKCFFERYWKKWTILVIGAMVVYIGFVLYTYIYKPIYQYREVTIQRLEINKDIYREIINSYFQSQENINKIINKDYPDPFK